MVPAAVVDKTIADLLPVPYEVITHGAFPFKLEIKVLSAPGIIKFLSFGIARDGKIPACHVCTRKSHVSEIPCRFSRRGKK